MSFTTLVSCKELSEHLHDPEWIIVDCSFTLSDLSAGRQAYEREHIPGARYAHLDDDLSSPVAKTTGRHPLPEINIFAEKLGQWGISNTNQVVVYDEGFGAMAGRLWWLLKWMGHDNVALLDGGYPKWRREGYSTENKLPHITATTYSPIPDNSMLVTTENMEQHVANKDSLIIDARMEERFTGFIEPLDKVAGHIPGAINLPFEDNLEPGGFFLSTEELQKLYRDILGETSADNVIHMCGSGVTACHNILAMEHAGITGSRLYAGSWSEWITDSSRAVEKDD